MSSLIKLGIIGDYDGRPGHIATEDTIKHCADKLGLELEATWVPTETLLEGVEDKLNSFDGIWCAPGSPYQSMLGALNGIQYARENNVPFLGTCGGFQHAAIEFARNVLQIRELQSDDFDPYSPNIVISALSCSLVQQTRNIFLKPGTIIQEIYGGVSEITEKYNCNFGLNKELQAQLDLHGLKNAGTDENDEVRILVLEHKDFFVGTLFQPQLSSTKDNPHPLILAYLSKIYDYHKKK